MEGVSEREGERVELWGGEVQREERGGAGMVFVAGENGSMRDTEISSLKNTILKI